MTFTEILGRFLPDLIIIVIILLFLRRGWKRGMVRTLGGLLSALIAIYVARYAAKAGSAWLASLFSSRLEPWVNTRLTNLASGQSGGGGILSVIPGMGDLLDSVSASLIENLVPVVAYELAKAIAWLVLFVIVLILAWFLVRLLVRILNRLFRLPGLNFINRFIGAVLGVLMGVLLLRIVLLALKWFGILPTSLIENTWLLWRLCR